MLRLFNKTLRVGIVTEPVMPERDPAFEELGEQLHARVGELFNGSLAVRAVDAGSCNACELEVHALNNPYYGIERFGVRFVASPRHADLLLVTGPVSKHMEAVLKRTYDATPDPKLVLATGDCAANGGEFGCSYASCGGVEKVIPVDGIVHGCPPNPRSLMKAILVLIEKRVSA